MPSGPQSEVSHTSGAGRRLDRATGRILYLLSSLSCQRRRRIQTAEAIQIGSQYAQTERQETNKNGGQVWEQL